jgi:uncharacterized protein YjgD (DUF1641 family)
MAQPIPFTVPLPDPRTELQDRLRNAPVEHAQALLAAHDVLQGLYDSGVLDVMRGVLGSRDKVLDIVVGATGSPTALRAIRNLLLLTNMLGSIEPEVLDNFIQATPKALNMMVRQPERPGLWTLVKDFLWNQDFRHGMAAINTMIEVFGRALADETQTQSKSANEAEGKLM